MQSRHKRLYRALYACAGVFLLAALAFGASLLQEGAATAQTDVPGLPAPAGAANSVSAKKNSAARMAQATPPDAA